MTRSERAWEAFQARVTELGGSVVEPTWLGNGRPHRVVCAVGHSCAPHPSSLQQGGGFCRFCAGHDRSDRAWAAFKARVAELGGIVLEPAWLGAHARHTVRCSAGHTTGAVPHHVRKGGGFCVVCAGKDPATVEAAFRRRVAALGGVVIEPAWLGNQRQHRVICPQGHECSPRPASIQQGQGLCRVCAGLDSATVEAEFRRRVADLGGLVIEPVWLGTETPHRVICPAGHECAPRPHNVSGGQGICLTCTGNDSDRSEARFRARVSSLGGVIKEPTWLGTHEPHRVICIAGHECAPRPAGVIKGQGLCRTCAGSVWNIFYVVEDDVLNRMKFGITSDDPRPRLGEHARNGYRSVVRLLMDLPGDTAPAMERRVISTLKLAGEQAIHGREYFNSRVIVTVLDIVDHYPILNREEQVSW